MKGRTCTVRSLKNRKGKHRMSLYEVTTTYRRLIEAIENEEIPAEAIADTLEAVNGEWGERADAVLSSIKNYRAECEAIRAEEKALAERRKRKERVVERLTEYLSNNMLAVGVATFENARHSVRFRTSSAVVVEDMDALIRYAERDPEAVKVKTEIVANKDYIKEALKSGDVDGVRLEIRTNIQIK